MKSPFHRISALVAALTIATTNLRAMPINSPRYGIVVGQRDDSLAKLLQYTSRGKGGKRPRHPSKRFVAQDKRDAKKARRRK